jgi:hypothetical protein
MSIPNENIFDYMIYNAIIKIWINSIRSRKQQGY